MKGLLVICSALLLAMPAAAHVGSPDVFFEGSAGPYRLFVTVRLPLVIPGVAEIQIRSESGDLRELRIVPLRLTGPGSNLPPTPDLAKRSSADPRFFSGNLWLMEGGSLQVRILADGGRGQGEVSVPVPSVAQRVLPMQKGLGLLLLGLMLFLAVGAVSIAAAGAREGELDPHESPGPAERRRARFVIVIAAAAVAGIVYLGGHWWDSEARVFANNVYKPPHLSARLEPGGRLVLHSEGGRIPVGFRGRSARSRLDDLILDHGHLVHLFLVRAPQMDRFWHLHPQQVATGAFTQELPAISAGHYRIFADIVHRSGFPETMVGGVDLPDLPGKALAGDDCGWSGAPLSQISEDSTVSPLPDAGRMIWEREPFQRRSTLKAGTPASFRFLVEEKDGRPARDLEPYMGMPGHAEFMSADGSVFAHVHPAGSVSMAALEIAQSALAAGPDAVAAHSQAMDHVGMAMSVGSVAPEVSFPYGFPKPGAYRIFVQIKRAGRVETGMFDASVKSGGSGYN
jgi:hypothetical protein